MASIDNLAGAVFDSKGEKKEKALQQYEPCKIEGCKYRNEEGFCAKETCVVLNEHPQTAMMVTKICMFCGTKFTTNMDSMQMQICPQCLKEAIEATRRGGDGTNELSGTVNVGDTKLKDKYGNKKVQGFDSSAYKELFGSGALSELSNLSDIAMSNIQGDLDNLKGKDLSKDLGENLSPEDAKDILSQGGGHKCMFCGEEIVQNPSLFFPCCQDCFDKLLVLLVDTDIEVLIALSNCDPDHLELAGTSSHCYECDDW